MDSDFQLKDIISILKRRYMYFVVPFVLLSPIAVAVAILLPPIYQSSGLILIESPQISQAIVAGSIGSAARERVEVIQRRVMTRTNILSIAGKFNVISTSERKKLSSSEIVDVMREGLGVEFISAGTQRGASTIAFKVTYDHRDPRIAARVANELVTLFLNENVRSRTQIATETTEFLNQEAEKLERQLIEIENKIADYKQENSDALPENLNIQLQMRERLEEQIRRMTLEVNGYEEELRFLDVQIRTAQAQYQSSSQQKDPATTPRSSDVKLPEVKEFFRLKNELEIARSTKADQHPDVRALKRILEAEGKRLIAAGGIPAIIVQIAIAENALRELQISESESDLQKKAEYGKELISLRESLEEQLSTTKQTLVENSESRNGALFNLTLEDLNLKKTVMLQRVDAIKNNISKQNVKLSEIESSIIQAPQIDRVLRTLNRDYQNAQQKYNEIRNKAMEAQIAENVEEASKSERFVLLEPPSVPDQPEKPDRKKILVMGILVAFAIGIGALAGIEVIDGGIRGVDNLASIINMVPLAVIPYIETVEERRKRFRRQCIGVIVVVAGVAALIGATHFTYMPLDTLFYKIIDRFG